MLITDFQNYIGMQRTALIYKSVEENSNKYYILQLEKTKEGKFKVTFKYGRRGKKPRVIPEIRETYSSACALYNDKIKYLKRSRNYREVEFMDIMANDSSAFFDFNELEMID